MFPVSPSGIIVNPLVDVTASTARTLACRSIDENSPKEAARPARAQSKPVKASLVVADLETGDAGSGAGAGFDDSLAGLAEHPGRQRI